MWLLEERTLRAVEQARQNATISPEQQREHEERVSAARDGTPRNLSLAGDVADIRVEGVLTKRSNFLLWLFGFGNTSYEDIQSAISMARTNPDVKQVRFLVDSPGGEVEGLFDTLSAIEGLRAEKKVSVRAVRALSAAYGIAAAAGSIEAQNAAAEFGSVGVAADVLLPENFISLTNSDSPEKRPDLSTEEGRQVVVKHLDDVFAVFAEAIARGRDTTIQDVKENFGRGGILLAGDAKRRGMIDRIAKPALRAVPGKGAAARAENETDPTADPGGVQQPRKGKRTMEEMDEKTLRAQHPDLYEAVVQQGVQKGTSEERDRVCAHLTMGEQSGDLKTAFEAIRAGTGMSLEMQARYMAAGMNRADRQVRQDETDEAGKVADGAKPAAEDDHLANKVADLFVEKISSGEVSHG